MKTERKEKTICGELCNFNHNMECARKNFIYDP